MAIFQFTESEKALIKNAVSEAEKATSGEIVPYFVNASDKYEETNLRAALYFALVALGLAGVLSYSWSLPFVITPLEVVIFTIALSAIGYLMSRFVDPVRKWLTPTETMLERVEQRALTAFLTEEIFNTKNRTGIIILVSHFEHMVEVFGDSGINAKVDQNDWQHVVDVILTGIKSGNPAEGIADGIKKCGELLVAAGVDKPADNPNELSDDIRLG
ncbi:TPM domain-containing protein [Fulvivirga sp.]|uniref:TPM domain-containing protein n=1 Tax=Fulvivirga sp. TaxID=1931237 RepID=UPI0032EEAB0A